MRVFKFFRQTLLLLYDGFLSATTNEASIELFFVLDYTDTLSYTQTQLVHVIQFFGLLACRMSIQGYLLSAVRRKRNKWRDNPDPVALHGFARGVYFSILRQRHIWKM